MCTVYILYIWSIKTVKIDFYNNSKAAIISKARQQPQKWLIIFGFVVNHP